MIEKSNQEIGIVRQCELLSISRSSVYYRPVAENELNLKLMRLIDEQFMETPFYGSRQMTCHLRQQGFTISRKRVQRLMHIMGLRAIYQKPGTSAPHLAHKIYPYLLRNLTIDRPGLVWCARTSPTSRYVKGFST